jgi:hypothetical protein
VILSTARNRASVSASPRPGARRNRFGRWRRAKPHQIWPEFLPDGKHYLYLSLGAAPYQQGIYAASLDSNDRTFIVATNTNAAYLQSGQLLFTRGSVLMAQPFDIGSLKLSGGPRPVADHIESAAARTTTPASPASRPLPAACWCGATANRTSQSFPQWFDRTARNSPSSASPRTTPTRPLTGRQQTGRLHPRSADRDARHLDLRSAARRKDPADLRSRRRYRPHLVAGRDADRLHSDRSGQRNIYWKLADGSGPDELLLGGNEAAKRGGLVAGRQISYLQLSARRAMSPRSASGRRPQARDLLEPGSPPEGQFSPNGRWVAYRSNESGSRRSMCRGSRWTRRSRAANGRSPRREGNCPMAPRRQGAVLPLRHAFFAVDVKTDGPSFQAGVPKRLFTNPHVIGSATHAIRLWSPGTASGSWSLQQVRRRPVRRLRFC